MLGISHSTRYNTAENLPFKKYCVATEIIRAKSREMINDSTANTAVLPKMEGRLKSEKIRLKLSKPIKLGFIEALRSVNDIPIVAMAGKMKKTSTSNENGIINKYG